MTIASELLCGASTPAVSIHYQPSGPRRWQLGATVARAPEGEGGGDNGQLSIEGAVEALRGGGEQQQAVERELDDDETPADPIEAEDASEPVEAAADEDAELPEPGAEATVVKAPHWWTADEKERFAQLTPELQATVLATEGRREQAVSKTKQEAAEARKTAEVAATEYRERAAKLDDLVPKVLKDYQDRWAVEPDWAAIATEYGAEQAIIAQANYGKQKKAETEQLQGLIAAREQAEADRFTQHVEKETALLADLSPELSDPKEGNKRKVAVASFLKAQGVGEDQLRWISASELSIAYDAMQFRQMKAKTKADLAKGPKTAATAASPAVRPGAATSQTPRQRSVEQISGRLSRTGSVDDGVAMLQALRKAG